MPEATIAKLQLPTPRETKIDLAENTGTIPIIAGDNFDHWQPPRTDGKRSRRALGILLAVLSLGTLVGAAMLYAQVRL